MDFPNFENNNNDNNQSNNDNNFPDFNNQQQQQYSNFDENQFNNNNNFDNNEIQIENVEFTNGEQSNQMNFNNNNDFSHGQNTNSNMGMDWNQMGSNQMPNDFQNSEIDEEERNRIQLRKEEEDARREKIVKKMNYEMKIKQEFRDKAREYIDNWNE